MSNDTSLLNVVRQTILQAGALAKDFFDSQDSISFNRKSPKDLVTQADIQVERFIKSQLNQHFPEFGFWGEESGKIGDKENCWIVDPIDGTHSFFRKQYFWSISIALQLNSEIAFGAVYAPALNDLYIGEKGKGATKNGSPMSVSETDRLQDAMVCTGFACLRDSLEQNNLPRFTRIALETRDQRRLGSAALELCMVGEGLLDAFWEQNLNLYDIAAGTLIANEAGASVSDFSGKSGVFPDEVLVTNGKILEALLPLM